MKRFMALVNNRSLFVYKMPRDFGFAPNPFHGICTLATCKPKIRRAALPGDWVVGCGSCAKDSAYRHKIIYAMKVSQKLKFDEYWESEKFKCKRPCLHSSLKNMYGDNIYHKDKLTGVFIQEDSHHSLPNGERNDANYKTDTSADAVLISDLFWYWGKDAVPIPESLKLLRNLPRDHKRFGESENKELFGNLESWLASFVDFGQIGEPIEFDKPFRRYKGA